MNRNVPWEQRVGAKNAGIARSTQPYACRREFVHNGAVVAYQYKLTREFVEKATIKWMRSEARARATGRERDPAWSMPQRGAELPPLEFGEAWPFLLFTVKGTLAAGLPIETSWGSVRELLSCGTRRPEWSRMCLGWCGQLAARLEKALHGLVAVIRWRWRTRVWVPPSQDRQRDAMMGAWKNERKISAVSRSKWKRKKQSTGPPMPDWLKHYDPNNGDKLI